MNPSGPKAPAPKMGAQKPGGGDLAGEKLPTLDELVKRAADLEMMPQVARKVMELVADENANASQLAGLIEKDPNITARVLKIANSAFYGLRREVKTIQQAIVILGFKSLRSLVVASSSKALHKRFGITEQLMWDHSVGTAIAAKLLSFSFPNAVGEVAFVGGLLHNVGKTIMNNECPKHFMEVMKLVYNEGLSPMDAEKNVFQYSHPEVGFRVTGKWGIPKDLSTIIQCYSLANLDAGTKSQAFENASLKAALACVEMGSQACQVLGIGFRQKDPKIDLKGLESFEILQLDDEKLKSALLKIEEAFQRERSAFN